MSIEKAPNAPQDGDILFTSDGNYILYDNEDDGGVWQLWIPTSESDDTPLDADDYEYVYLRTLGTGTHARWNEWELKEVRR